MVWFLKNETPLVFSILEQLEQHAIARVPTRHGAAEARERGDGAGVGQMRAALRRPGGIEGVPVAQDGDEPQLARCQLLEEPGMS